MKKKLDFTKNGKIRIISGKWKGRKIPVIHQLSVRPTTNRIRETLFNWLSPVISNAMCLDCFAGSGALGLESLSRGAKKVTFIDQNRICITTLTQIFLSFQERKSTVIHSDCRFWLQKSNDMYDIVFIDPPFHNYSIIFEVIFLLEKYNHLKKQSWIYIETPKNKNIFNIYKFPEHWFLYRKQTTQTMLCYLYFRNL